jgi:uncharacterized repeat protein (TIGR03803 family)
MGTSEKICIPGWFARLAISTGQRSLGALTVVEPCSSSSLECLLRSTLKVITDSNSFFRRTLKCATPHRYSILLAVSALPIQGRAQAQTLTVLNSFSGRTDGAYPLADLLMDRDGNLYGTTNLGGAFGYGTVFKLALDASSTP